MAGESAESLAQMVAARVRELIGAAEQRAEEIVRQAEAEAERIRARAESEARERADQVRSALEALETSLGGAAAAGPKAEVDPSRATVPEPEPPLEPEPQPPEQPEPGPVTVPEPEPTPVPEPEPPPDEADRPSAAAAPESSADLAAARIVAAKMALDGASREEIDQHLAETYGLADRTAILDEVLARVGR